MTQNQCKSVPNYHHLQHILLKSISSHHTVTLTWHFQLQASRYKQEDPHLMLCYSCHWWNNHKQATHEHCNYSQAAVQFLLFAAKD